MVKYGVGDTATIMNDTSKGWIQDIVDDMYTYTASSETETETETADKLDCDDKEFRVAIML